MTVSKTGAPRRHRSFKSKNVEESEPLTFDIDDETFTCFPEIPGKVLLDIMRPAAIADEDTRGVVMAVSVLDFFEKVMEPDEHERLAKRLDDPKRIVDMEQMSEIMSWLIEEYTTSDNEGRPTKQPSGS
jgi:hypothetical protein